MGMVRRTKLIHDLDRSTLDDYDECMSLFIDDLDIKNMSFHTKRWHSENLRATKKAFEELNLSTALRDIDKRMIQECIVYWKNIKEFGSHYKSQN